MKSLQGKVAIVIGSGRGIGAATAKLLASQGARVTVADLRAELAEETAASICSVGGDAIHATVDAASEEQIKAAIDATIAKWGKIDILHNNAAPMHLLPEDKSTADTEARIWDETFAVIARGSFLACKYAIPHMQRNGGGSIINTSSMASQRATLVFHAYGAAKAAVNTLTMNIAMRYGPDRIRCNAIAPGFITHVEQGQQPDLPPAFRREWLDAMVVPRIGIDHDIARMVLFLAQDDADYITGQVFNVDGGATMWATWARIGSGGAPEGACDP